MTVGTSLRLSRASMAALDEYAETVLACSPEPARAGGVHLVGARLRALPGWHGYTLPVVGLSFAYGAILAARPDLVERLRREMGSDVNLARLDRPALRRVLRAIQRVVPHAFTLAGDFRAADAGRFTPTPTQNRAEHLPSHDPAVLQLRSRFDGDVFGVRGPHGRVVSWAALKLKSPSVWEIAVATEADYRGRGFARDVVAAATRYTLDQGRVPIYIHDLENSTSAFVARSLGYQVYAEIVLAEF
jgi:hypothetical protein